MSKKTKNNVRGSAFPYLCQLSDGRILADHQMGQAFESVDGASYLSQSRDGGVTWSKPWKIFPHSNDPFPKSESSKVTQLPDGRLICLVYRTAAAKSHCLLL